MVGGWGVIASIQSYGNQSPVSFLRRHVHFSVWALPMFRWALNTGCTSSKKHPIGEFCYANWEITLYAGVYWFWFSSVPLFPSRPLCQKYAVEFQGTNLLWLNDDVYSTNSHGRLIFRKSVQEFRDKVVSYYKMMFSCLWISHFLSIF